LATGALSFCSGSYIDSYDLFTYLGVSPSQKKKLGGVGASTTTAVKNRDTATVPHL